MDETKIEGLRRKRDHISMWLHVALEAVKVMARMAVALESIVRELDAVRGLWRMATALDTVARELETIVGDGILRESLTLAAKQQAQHNAMLGRLDEMRAIFDDDYRVQEWLDKVCGVEDGRGTAEWD